MPIDSISQLDQATNTDSASQSSHTPDPLARVNALRARPIAAETAFNVARVGKEQLGVYLGRLRKGGQPAPPHTAEKLGKVIHHYYQPEQVFLWLQANDVQWTPVAQQIPKTPGLRPDWIADKLKQEILELRKERNRLKEINEKYEISFSTMASGRDAQGLLNRGEILMSQISRRDWCGVYFLIKDREIVYVGQSVNVWARVCQHKDKDFDSFTFEPCPLGSLDMLERLYISKYEPILNKVRPGPCIDHVKRARETLARIIDESVVSTPPQ